MTISTDDISLIFKALNFAAHKHRNQQRKNEERHPYINHPIAVAKMLWEIGEIHDINTLVAGILHDTIEDTDAPPEELESSFGSKVASIVQEVTDKKGLPEHIRRHRQVERARRISLEARCIKLADKICNIQDILTIPPVNWTSQKKLEYINWAEEVISGLRGTNEKLENYFDQLCNEAHQKLGRV